MDIETVRRTAFAMPLTSPAFPIGPYRFLRREYFIITYRTDPAVLHAVVPEPLEVGEPLVHYGVELVETFLRQRQGDSADRRGGELGGAHAHGHARV